jgi:hypothetical protein
VPLIALLSASAAGAAVAPDFPQAVVFATNSVHLQQGSEVVSGDVIVNAASPGPTLSSEKELTVGLGVHTPAGYALKADRIKVKQSAVVGGEVFCNQLDDGSASVSCAPLALPVFTDLPPFFTGPSDGADVLVGQNGVLDLPAGSYGLLDVRSGGIVRFTGGVYDLREIDTGPSATLVFLAPSTVRVAGKLRVEQDSFVGPDPLTGLAASDLVFYVAGINGNNGNLGATPKAAHLGIGSTVLANFYVPNGTLWLRQGTVATGAFLARDVDVGLNVQVTLDSAFFNHPPVAADDSATVEERGSVSLLDSGEASLLANDSDPDLDPLTVTTAPVSAPGHGAVVLHADGTFTYTHDGGEGSSDAFVYEACDDAVPPLCATAQVAITILPRQQGTFADAQAVDTPVDTPVVITLTGGADPENLPLIFTILADPAHGTVSAPTTESPTSARTTYSPEPGFTGVDTFTFQVEDAAGGTATAVVTVTVSDESGGADVEAVNQSVTTDQETPVTITLRGTTTLEETVAISIATPPAHGTLGPLSPVPGDPDAQLVTYTPAAGFSGGDSFTFDACVSTGCDTGTVTLTVRPVSVRVMVTLQGTGGGQVSSQPAGIDCGSVCSAGFGGESAISLFATADPGSVFAGWSGDADCLDGQLTPDADKSCIATFDVEEPPGGDVTVSVSVTGTGNGTVVSLPEGIDCGSVCQATFPAFERVELMATAGPGSVFAGWSGSGDCLDGFLDGAGNASCVATFNLAPQQVFTLTVVLAGSGSGTVTSSPAGINCPGQCSAAYAPGTQVRLTARADDDSGFAGWNGDCVVNAVFPFVAFATLDADKTCTATFTR